MIYNRYTISLSRVSLMFETKNINLIKRVRIWMPARYVNKRYELFMSDFQSMFAEDELRRVVNNELIRTVFFNRVVLYRSFIDLAIIKRLNNDHLLWYKSEFGSEFDNLKQIESRIKLLQSKIKEYSAVENKKDGVSFETIIIGVESVLNIKIDRYLKLYQFKYYFDTAIEKIKQLKDG